MPAKQEAGGHQEEFNLRKGILSGDFLRRHERLFLLRTARRRPHQSHHPQPRHLDGSVPRDCPCSWSYCSEVSPPTSSGAWRLNIRNHSRPRIPQRAPHPSPDAAQLHLLCALAGTTWYFQFFFYSMGETQMGTYKFSSWTLHMASIIIFSSLWGIALHEWRGAGLRTMRLAGRSAPPCSCSPLWWSATATIWERCHADIVEV